MGLDLQGEEAEKAREAASAAATGVSRLIEQCKQMQCTPDEREALDSLGKRWLEAVHLDEDQSVLQAMRAELRALMGVQRLKEALAVITS